MTHAEHTGAISLADLLANVEAKELEAASLMDKTVVALQQAIHERGALPEDLAHRVGVSVPDILAVVNGDGNVNIAAFARVLSALGYRAEWSLTDMETGRPLVPAERESRHLEANRSAE
ncbi:hypothetical protein M2390_001230 [Mycetocola sp. BIGb0189]|uniref:helix-turn-helix domain-containing protein n=1 Tax=Mycetocola sp. BIGb0189 TaxID=2940604 RepID=UPI00216A725D|nr:hypothetical protein [Mycetocola sp. BIGb0189]MCS4276058.1 hypothetical protein [Mycetocola sp. BIGb0189]